MTVFPGFDSPAPPVLPPTKGTAVKITFYNNLDETSDERGPFEDCEHA